MGNKYVDEHLNEDSLSGLGEIYSSDTGNSNPKISIVGVSIDEDKTLSLKIGSGATFPVLDESVPRIQGGRDYLSMLAYSYDDVKDSALGLTPMEKYIYLVDKYMKQRQSFMLDVNSYNSQGMVMMSGARRKREGFDDPSGVKKLGYVPKDFSALSVGLSTFQVAKISREKTIVSFDENGYLSLVFDPEGLIDGFTGSIEYEITDNNKTIEDMLYRKNVIVTGRDVGLKFYNLPEHNFVESVEMTSCDAIVELMTSESVTPIDVDDKILLYGEGFLVNKTSKCIRVTIEGGSSYSLNPYAVLPVEGAKIAVVTVFKESFVKPSSIRYIGEKTTLYPMNEMNFTAVDGKFIEEAKMVLVDIDESSATVLERNEQGDTYFGQYQISLDTEFEDISFHQFGDNNEPIRAVKISGKYLYFSGGEVFIKNESDVNFTEVSLPVSRNGEGKRSINVCGVTFSSLYDTMLGGVTKNSSFMYEMNYIISENSIESEIIGDVYPVGFYRIEYIKQSCIEDELPEYPMETGHTTSKNIYTAGEVSVVLSKDDGIIGISNSKYSEVNTIVYSYLSAFGRWSDTPFVVESFGHVSRQTMNQSQENHFLSVKLNSIAEARSKRTYCGSIEKIDAEYIVCWVKVRNVDSGESFLFLENEYTDEFQRHLGFSPFLTPGTLCRDTPLPISKLTYISDPFKYTTGMVGMGESLKVGEPEIVKFSTNTVITEYQEGHTASHTVKSDNTIDGFGLYTICPNSDICSSHSNIEGSKHGKPIFLFVV